LDFGTQRVIVGERLLQEMGYLLEKLLDVGVLDLIEKFLFEHPDTPCDKVEAVPIDNYSSNRD